MSAETRWRVPLTAGVVALAYVIAGKAGLALAVANASVTAIWPPTGIALAAILLAGTPAAAGVFAGAFFVNFTTTGHVPGSLGIALGNTLEGVLGALLARRWAGGVAGFRSPRGLLTLAGVVVPLAAAASATVGVATLVWSGATAGAAPAPLWLTWWLGDLTGGLLIAPVLVLWAAPAPAGARPACRVEMAGFVVALIATGAAVFATTSPAGVVGAPIAFLLLPVLTWSAFRLGIRETATAVAGLAGMAVAGTLAGRGPFAYAPADGPFLVLQAFMAVMGTTSLVMAALVADQRAMMAALEHRRGALEHRVVTQTADLLRSEQDFQRQARLLQLVLESISEGVIVVDRDGRLVQVNPEARRIWGVSAGALPADYAALRAGDRSRIYLRDGITACPDDRLPLARALQGESVDEETYLVRGPGRAPDLWLGKSARPLRDGDGNPIGAVALVRDITASRRARELQREKEVAEAANRTKSLFLATVSHELRTPLTAIIGYVNLLLAGRSESPAESRHFLERVLENGRLLLEDIDDLLDLAKIEAGRMSARLEPLDAAAFAAEVVARFELQAKTRALSLRLEAEPDLPMVSTDAAKLRRILGNIIGNALKFTERGGVSVAVRRAGGEVAIRVTDTGIGIPAAKLGEVFDAFHQLDQGGPRKYGGVGLGLAICRSLAELIGARLAVESREGGGSTFTMLLPVMAVTARPRTAVPAGGGPG